MNSEWEELRNRLRQECNIPYVSILAIAPEINKVNLDRRRAREERASALYDGQRIGTYKGRDI